MGLEQALFLCLLIMDCCFVVALSVMGVLLAVTMKRLAKTTDLTERAITALEHYWGNKQPMGFSKN